MCNEIQGLQDSLGFYIPHRGLGIPGTLFQFLSARFQIPKPRILDSTSKTFLESGFHKQKFPGFGECVHYVERSSHLEWNPDFSGVKFMCLTGKGKLCLVWIIRNFEKSRVREIGILLYLQCTAVPKDMLRHLRIAFYIACAGEFLG